jgi:hypothetical protein
VQRSTEQLKAMNDHGCGVVEAPKRIVGDKLLGFIIYWPTEIVRSCESRCNNVADRYSP